MKFRRNIDSEFNYMRFSIEKFNDMILFMKFDIYLMEEFEELCVDESEILIFER